MPKINIRKFITWNIKSILSTPKNLIFRALDIPLKPKWIVFMATDRCNSHCTHCNIWQQKPTENHLKPNEIEKIFSDKLFKNVEYVLCTGGEPTIRDDIEEVILSLHKALPKATLQLSTNAILPERVLKVVATAMQNNINFEVGVSLDGIGDEHDKIRGVKGNFEKADWLLHKLVEFKNRHNDKLNIAAGIVVSNLTANSIYKVREYAKLLNIDFIEAWYNINSFYGNYKEEDKAKLREKFIEVVKTQPISLVQEKWVKWLNNSSIKFPCFAMHTFCVVKCSGDIIPCLSLWDTKSGNIKDASPAEVWHSADAKKAREVIKNCEGCLNAWGTGWSFKSNYCQILSFYPRYLYFLMKELRKAFKL